MAGKKSGSKARRNLPQAASASIETKRFSGTSVPADWMFDLFGGGVATDYAVTGRQALEVPAVASAITLISGSIASLGILVEARDGSQWKPATDHPVARLLESEPNDWSDTFTLIRDLVASALTCNEGGLAWVNKRDGEAVEIVHYAQGSFTVDCSTDGRNEPSYRVGQNEVGTGDVIHLRGPFTKCPLSLAAGAIGVAHKLERHVGSLFARGARPSGVLKFPAKLGADTAPRIKASWESAHGGAGNSGRTAVLEEGGDWVPLTLNSVDAELVDTWKFAILEIGRAFRVPPGALYDFERQTWGNSEQASKEWLAGLEFWLRPLEGALRRALFAPKDRANYRIRFDRDDFTSVDLTARATAINGLIASRVLNPNEGRDWLGLAPRDGGDEYQNPHINPSATANSLPPTEGGAA